MIIFISPPFGNYFKKFKINTKKFKDKNEFIEFVPIRGSFTLQARDGLLTQIVKTLRYSFTYKGWVNKIGLRNKGIDYAIDKYKQGDYKDDIISVAVMNPDEIPILLEKIPIDMNIELNISCPNVGKHISDVGVEKFINRYRRWCILKLSPTIEESQIIDFYNKGFRQFHCSNTLPTEQGGVSGKVLKEYTESNTKFIKEKYNDVKVVCGGGITDCSDIEMYRQVGGDYFSISTLCFSPIQFIKLLFEL